MQVRFKPILTALLIITSLFVIQSTVLAESGAEGVELLKTETRKAGDTIELRNPLGEAAVDVPTIAGRVIKAAVAFMGSLGLLMFVYGGFLWLTSGGSADKVKQGKDTMVWATLGIALVLSSYALVLFILRAFSRV